MLSPKNIISKLGIRSVITFLIPSGREKQDVSYLERGYNLGIKKQRKFR